MKYTQGEEEGHILAAVGDGPGRFLDIGAFHAKSLSNTRALYERGWSGLLIEPSPEPFAGLLREYGNDPRIELLCAAVGMGRAITKFHASADALTTSDAGNFEKWKEAGGFYGSFYVPVVTLAELLHQFGAFEFVSLDAEGSSVELFLSLLATQMRPKCICVEHDQRVEECTEAAAAAGYRAVYFSGENLVFA